MPAGTWHYVQFADAGITLTWRTKCMYLAVLNRLGLHRLAKICVRLLKKIATRLYNMAIRLHSLIT